MSSSDAEVFDVCDESGRVIGQAPRLRVHREGLLHQSVHVLLVCGARLLLQKRSALKRICPSLWDLSCAEHLQPGEDHAQAALRGMREELGLGVEASQLELLREKSLSRHEYEAGYLDNEFTALYCVEVQSAPRLELQEEEVCDAQWKTLQELEELVAGDSLTPWFLLEWDAIRKRLA